ncbi:MAG: putative lipid II flippase FtsW [Mariprofundaceae bacterium]
MKQLLAPDKYMAAGVFLLVVISLLAVSTASIEVSAARYGDTFRIIRHWSAYMVVGLLLMWVVSRIDVLWWKGSAIPILILGLLLLSLVLIPGFGLEINGAQRWLALPGITAQPVEIMKPALVIYMAYYMSAFPKRLQHFSTGLAPMLVVLVVVMGLLLLQPDFGNAVLLAVTCVGIWFVGGIPLRHLFGLAIIALPVGGWVMVSESYRMRRLLSFLDPWADAQDSGYQLVQSMLAFGAGGLQGVGLGQGIQKLFYLPEPFTDFIAAVLAEELGLLGTLGLVGLFSLVLWRGLLLACQLQDQFQRLLVVGCMLLWGLTFLINMGAVMGVLPTKGMPIPLVSYGGSALFGSCVLLGLVFSVQRHQLVNRRHRKQT